MKCHIYSSSLSPSISVGWIIKKSRVFLLSREDTEGRRDAESKTGPRRKDTVLTPKWNDPGFFAENCIFSSEGGAERGSVVTWLTQPIENCDSGSLLSLLGQNRCEKREGATWDKKGVRIEYQSQILTLLSFFTGFIPLFAQHFINLSQSSPSPLYDHLSVLLFSHSVLSPHFAINILLYCNKIYYLLTSSSKYICFPSGYF